MSCSTFECFRKQRSKMGTHPIFSYMGCVPMSTMSTTQCVILSEAEGMTRAVGATFAEVSISVL